MKRFLIGTVFATFSVIGLASIALAENWVTVVTGEVDGKTYHIDLDSRQSYMSQTGWRHVAFKLSSAEDRHWHAAIAACNPYQLNVPDYKWGWAIGSKSYSVYTVSGVIARAACNW
jgi:hypothetical protein